MRSFLNETVKNIPPSGIRKFFDLVVSAGPEVVSLGVGEPDFPTPWAIRESAIFALEKGFTSYSENAGLLELREEVSLDIARKTTKTYNPKTEILITNGVSEGIDLALRAIINKGDKILVPDPGFVCYENLVKLAGGVCVFYDPLDLTSLSTVKEADLKGIILNFPGNPIGNIFSDKDLDFLADYCREHDLIALSDEIYDDLSFTQKHRSFLEVYPDKTIYFNGLSKNYAMTGFRIGWVCADAILIEAMNKIHQYSAMCASAISQLAGIEALRRGTSEKLKMVKIYDERRHFCIARLTEMGLPFRTPEGAFYIFIDIRKSGLDEITFCEQLLLAEKLAVVPGSAFGKRGRGFIRITYAENQESLTKAFNRLERFMKSCETV